jgi:hypothetical protein
MVPKRKQYTEDDLNAAVAMYKEGAKRRQVMSAFPNIPDRTIRQRAKQQQPLKKPGPAPILDSDMENDLQDWIIGMQCSGYPVSRDMILIKGNEMYHAMYGSTRSSGNLGRGWVEKFMKRHPVLTLRTSQVIKRVRNTAFA